MSGKASPSEDEVEHAQHRTEIEILSGGRPDGCAAGVVWSLLPARRSGHRMARPIRASPSIKDAGLPATPVTVVGCGAASRVGIRASPPTRLYVDNLGSRTLDEGASRIAAEALGKVGPGLAAAVRHPRGDEELASQRQAR